MIRHYIAAACLAVALPVTAQAATLDWSITADNAFSLYVSPVESVIGTLVFSDLNGPASQWSSVYSGSVAVSGIEYIQIVGYNYTSSNGLWNSPGTTNGGGDNPNALMGSFTLSAGSFANLTSSLVTGNNGSWSAIPVAPPSPDNPTTAPNPPWQDPTGPVQDYGANGVGPWGTVALPANADWIWSLPDNGAYADFAAQLLAPTNSLPSPIPAALPLFGTGLGLLGLMGWRRKRRAQALA